MYNTTFGNVRMLTNVPDCALGSYVTTHFSHRNLWCNHLIDTFLSDDSNIDHKYDLIRCKRNDYEILAAIVII